MASQQVGREKKSEQQGGAVEKDRVPKMTSHFESLTVTPAAKDSGGAETHHPAAGNVGKFEMKGVEEQDVGKEMRRSTAEMGAGGDADVSQYRQAAQQNSIDALRAAEERYNKAKGAEGKDSVKQTSQSSRDNLMQGAQAKDSLVQGAQRTSQVAAEKGAQAKDILMQGAQRTSQVAAEKGAQAKDSLMQGAQSTTQIAAEKGAQAKDSLMQGAQRTSQVTGEKGAQAKDSLMQGAQRTSQVAGAKGGELKDTAIQKGQPLYETTRDTVAGAGKTAADYTWKAKDVVAEKAVGAKDVVVESGKGTAGYVGGVATTVKDKAVVAGWGAAEYTAEKVVGATKAVANVTAGAAGYVGGTAVAAKDMVGSAGVSAKDYAAQKLAAAKDAVVATEESAKDYAARMRAEAEKNMQAKKAAEAKGEVWSSPTEGGKHDIAGAGRQAVEAAKETISKPVEKAGEFFQQEQQSEYGSRQPGQSTGTEGAGVFNAIGETIVEIGQTTKDMLVGKGQTPATTVKDSAAEQNK